MDRQTAVRHNYRPDIDGLRAVAVIAVIAFHLGFLPGGYFGVDVFFVISGYLITGIITEELAKGTFSLRDFYLRRIRRIIPLTLFVSTLTLLVGMVGMLPDDLENLAQSVFATNAFANNVLQAITTKDYWDVVNEYKPLMHTWSLGIEEQYYFIYPLLMLGLFKAGRKYTLPVLLLLSVASLALNQLPIQAFFMFYWMPFRFYELALGGLVAVAQRQPVALQMLKPVFLAGLVALLSIRPQWLDTRLAQPLVVVLTAGLLARGMHRVTLAERLLQNRIVVGIGLISFSLYMWHQPVLAFTRYYLTDVFTAPVVAAMCLVIFGLSVGSYFLVEKPFRNRQRIGTRKLLMSAAGVYAVLMPLSFLIHWQGGVIRDVPELQITKKNATRGIHARYNHAVHQFDRPFAEDGRVKVLVIGNSFARDWVNVLLAAPQAPRMDISYVEEPFSNPDMARRVAQADRIYVSEAKKGTVEALNLPLSKLRVVGTKSFGVSNGRFYNHRGSDYCAQRTLMKPGVLLANAQAREVWDADYVDIIARLVDANGKVPVFTPDCLFISQDTRHLTPAGAGYVSQLFEPDIRLLAALRESR